MELKQGQGMPEASSRFRVIGDLPLVRRLHQALAVGLAVFMLTLVVLREPFQGYLAQVQISGPATAGLDLDEAVKWLKKVEPHLAAVATPAGEISAKCEIRATYVAPHPRQAISHLDELADRWLYQYLPDRLQVYRRGTLASLRTAVTDFRQREDALQERLEGLRQRQVAELRSQGSGIGSQESGARSQEPPVGSQKLELGDQKSVAIAVVKSGNDSDGGNKLRERLESLKVQLSHLLGSHTDEHPEIVTLKSQINSLEKQLGLPETTSPNHGAGERQTSVAVTSEVRQTSGELELHSPRTEPESQVAIEITSIMSELAKVSRERQSAEQHLTERMQELSSGPTAAQWSAGPAHVVTRLGGTPRSLTLALAGVLACVGGIVMFRVTAVELVKPRIKSAAELASVIALPVIGDLAKCRDAAAGGSSVKTRRFLTPARLRIMTTVAEGFVAVAASACLISVAIDPSLAREVLADPFGTLAEVMGRCGA
jgi:hypothetical protein